MKKLILIIGLLLIFVSASSQTRLKFGNVTLKDTLTGAFKVTTGSIWTVGYDLHGDVIYIGDYNKVYLSDAPITGDFTISNTWNVATPEMRFWVELSNGTFRWLLNSGVSQMTLDINGLEIEKDLNVKDNLTVDSNLIIKNTAIYTIQKDNDTLTVNGSFMWIDSDDGTATNRTFILDAGTTVGQHLILQFFDTGGSGYECELPNAGEVLTADGNTITFDNDRENAIFNWDGVYWVEEGRDF